MRQERQFSCDLPAFVSVLPPFDMTFNSQAAGSLIYLRS